jgi:hypothetical protein
MAATTLTERYAPNLHGVLSCYDRLIVTGTLPGACYAGGMTSFLYSRGIRIFDYPKFAEPLRDRIRQRAHEVCDANGVSIEHVNKSHIRKEDLVARVLAVRGHAPGLVHVLSAMESCPSYKPWLDKSNGHVFLRGDTGKCLHYYFYFIDEEFGLCYLRVPTWAPFGLQFYCNGHSALACSLKREGIEFVQEDNAFVRVADLARAQALADAFSPERLHRRLTCYAHWLCPVADVFAQDDWHWSIRQAELLRPRRPDLAANAAARRVQHSRLAPSRSRGSAGAGAVGNDAPAQAIAHAWSDQKGHAHLSLLLDALGSRCHRRSVLAHPIQHRSRYGCCALKSSQETSKLIRLETRGGLRDARPARPGHLTFG